MSERTKYSIASFIFGVVILFVGGGGFASLMPLVVELPVFWGFPLMLLNGAAIIISLFVSFVAMIGCTSVADDIIKLKKK